jgi:hypothetical protein
MASLPRWGLTQRRDPRSTFQKRAEAIDRVKTLAVQGFSAKRVP